MGLHDSEPWVSMLADLMRTFPSTGQLNTEVSAPDTNRKIYMDLLSELRKTLKKHGDQTDSVLPLECHFLNKNAFISVVGHQPQVTTRPPHIILNTTFPARETLQPKAEAQGSRPES